jgi:hypothetical protein
MKFADPEDSWVVGRILGLIECHFSASLHVGISHFAAHRSDLFWGRVVLVRVLTAHSACADVFAEASPACVTTGGLVVFH